MNNLKKMDFMNKNHFTAALQIALNSTYGTYHYATSKYKQVLIKDDISDNCFVSVIKIPSYMYDFILNNGFKITY